MNEYQTQTLRKLVKALVRAEVEYSWAGAGDSESRPLAYANLLAARLRYDSYLKSLKEKDK
jgi:hypothetical protein